VRSLKRSRIVLLVLELSTPALAQVITTYAGTDWLFTGDGQPGAQSNIGPPVAVTTDPHGNVYVAVNAMNTLLKLVPSGTVSVVAGTGLRIFGGDGGPARAALLAGPSAVALDPSGNIYIGDANRVRKIAPDGIITTVAGTGNVGNGNLGFSGDNGPAVNAELAGPYSVSSDQAGNLFILDSGNYRVRKVATNGIITTIAGNGQPGYSGDGALATSAMISGKGGIAFDNGGNLYLADLYNCRVRKIDSSGVISTVVGTNFCGFSGDGGAATSTALNDPAAIAFDSSNNMYIADFGNQRIRRVDVNGNISTFAGNGNNSFAGDGSAALAAAFSNPSGIAVDANDNVYVADRDNARVRKILAGGGAVSTILGTGLTVGDGGSSSAGLFNNPQDVAVDSNGNVYVADSANYRIRVMTPGGVINTAVGTGRQGFSPDGTVATSAFLTNAASVTIDQQGNLVFIDSANLIRRVGSDGTLVAIAGGGPCCTIGNGVAATAAWISHALFLRYDSAGNLYFNNGPSVVQKLTPAGVIVTVAGNGNTQFSGDGGPATQAGLGQIVALALDTSGNLYIADYLNSRIRKVGQNGIITTIVGNGTMAYSPDGTPALQAALSLPEGHGGMVLDKSGNLYFSDGNQIRTIAQDGTVSTLAGHPGYPGFSGDGGLASAASFQTPCGMAFDSNGNLIVVDEFNSRIREILTGPVPLITLSEKGLTFYALSGASPATQTITVVNGAKGTLTFGIAVSTASGGNWLSVSSASGSVAAGQPGISMNVAVDASMLSPGDYYGRVVVTAPGVPNSPQSITVVVHVLAPGSVTGGVSLQPGGLVFTATQGGAAPAAQTLTLSTLSTETLNYGVTASFGSGMTWFKLANTSGNISAGNRATFTIQPSISGFAPGTYSAAITIAAGQAPVQQAQLVLIITAPAEPSSNAKATSPPCTASKLVPVITSLSSGFTVTAAWPIAIEASIFDDCAQPLLSGSVTATFSTGDPALALVSLENGQWAATWQTQTVAAQAMITVQAVSSSGALTGTAQIGGGLQANAHPPPQIASGGVLNGASFKLGLALAPGSLISIFGTHLGSSTASAKELPLPLVLNDTQVVVAGRALPLLYISDTQINAEIPFDLVINATQQVVVSRGNTVSLPEPISLISDQAGVFTQTGNGLGTGIVVVYSAGSQGLVGGNNPAKPGDAIVIYATGLGDVNPRVIAGAAAPLTPLSTTVAPVTVSIGGLQAKVFFNGLTPGYAGLYQVNAYVPKGVPAGNSVPLVLTQSGVSSAPVNITVQSQ